MFPVQALNNSVGMLSSIPYAFIPRSVNPAQGYLQSANQRSYDPETYGYDVIGPYATGYRGRRINYLLNTSSSVSMDDMKKWQADSVDVSAQEIVPFVIDAWYVAGNGNASVQIAVDWLSDWDFSMEIDIQAPTLWRFLVDALKYEIFDELRATPSADLRMPSTPVLERVIKENEANYLDDQSTGDLENRDEILTRALYRALDEMAADLGSNMSNWNYGDFHVIHVGHLASLTVIGGGPHRGWNTLNRAVSYWDSDAGQWRIVAGPSWRMVIDMGDIEHAYGVYTSGQSGNMFSRHWDDIFDLWYAYDEETEQYGYHLMHFYPTADLSEHFVERMITFVP
jgi:penicillin amidase